MQTSFWPAIITGGAAIIVAFISGYITLKITWINNKRQDDRWRADFFLKIKFEAVNDFITKLNITLKNLEYFCSEKGHYNMQVTLNLREKDPNHLPSKKDYKTDYVTIESVNQFIQLTKEKNEVLEESFSDLDKSYGLIKIYFNAEEYKVFADIMDRIRKYEHLISGNIKNFKGEKDINLFKQFLHYCSSIYKEGFEDIQKLQNDLEVILAKELYSNKVKQMEK
ncbi:hypothetical protein [Bacillus wiedmannii]|uniref:hypothetical protein n=1 Tax=Bacillus wiedmannii TaxID=1890302 RepID=UPI00086A882B|nr:hypothetical protein [Bacillus wiedmannii]SCN41591.1 Uncharacterized protein BCRIVMBC938_05844 [Bacillus wiedmannii]